jgi:hypothetical protein
MSTVILGLASVLLHLPMIKLCSTCVQLVILQYLVPYLILQDHLFDFSIPGTYEDLKYNFSVLRVLFVRVGGGGGCTQIPYSQGFSGFLVKKLFCLSKKC